MILRARLEKIPLKKVYVNDTLVGEASTWAEVWKLVKAKNVQFVGKPGAAEGPARSS